ncbi:MAG TPA: glycosyltransferase 87 family protein [Candidatus Saccharimonadales bacterium]|nr:glycosyltransferase 87 family protein [Candidatus Saccharimonadales bacterium]
MHKFLQPTGILLGVCLVIFVILSWILFYQDTRALLAISNFFPTLRTSLFATQTTLMHYKINTVPTLIFAIFAIASFFFYYYSLKQNISVKKTIISSLVFGLLLYFSYPGLSSDIFSYIFSDRIETVYHQNVWQVVPLTHNSDPFAIMADWKNTTRVYGGVNQLIYTLPSMIGRNNVVLLVALYKIVSSLFAIGIIWVLYLCLLDTEKNKQHIARNLRMVIWNPLFLVELFGSGHNDSIMIFFSLLSYFFFQRKRFLLAGIVLACAVQVKIIPVLLFAFLTISLLKNKAFKNTLLFVGSFLIINCISFWLMAVSPITFAQRVSYNAGVYWQSLPNLLRQVDPHINILFTGTFILILCLFIVYQIRTKQNPLLIYAYSLVFYLFFFTTAYWNWYALWVLTLIPLLKVARFKLFVVLFSFTSLFAYPVLWLSFRYDYHNSIWPIFTYLFIFVLPAVIFFLSKNKTFAKHVALFS